MPTLVAFVPALGVAAAMAIYAFEPLRQEWASRRHARGPGRCDTEA